MQRAIIRSLAAGLLFLVFGFSILPRKVLHDCLVQHKEGSVKAYRSIGAELGSPGFYCKIDQLVTDSPFSTTPIEGLPCAFPQHWIKPAVYFLEKPPVKNHSFQILRGPPGTCG